MSDRITFSVPREAGTLLRKEISSAFASTDGVEDHNVLWKAKGPVTDVECSREMGEYYLVKLDEIASAAPRSGDSTRLTTIAVAKTAIIDALAQGR
jgi:hypothetical protein